MLAQNFNVPVQKVAYIRSSIYVEQAKEGYIIDEQVRLLREKCQREGYEVYQEYVDRGISGKNIEGRPALKQLLEDVKKRKFDIVYVWKLSDNQGATQAIITSTN